MDNRIEQIREQLRNGRPLRIVEGQVVEEQAAGRPASAAPPASAPPPSGAGTGPQGVMVKPHDWGWAAFS